MVPSVLDSTDRIGPLIFGYNLISTANDRVIANPITLAQWQTIKGSNDLTLSGELKQTNSRGFINLLPTGNKLTLSGRLERLGGGRVYREPEARTHLRNYRKN